MASRKIFQIWGKNISLHIVAESQGFLFGRFQGSKKETEKIPSAS
jgi:hypothetical protein